MAVFYKLYQDNRKDSKFKGQWYARAVHTGTVNIDDLADEMQANCTVKRADIVAVLSELVLTLDEFTTNGNVKNVHVLFQPETKIEKNKTRVKALLNGCKVRELPKNAISEALAGE